MVQGFEDLTQEQFETLKKAISWITLLLAGADGKIEKEETAWAEKLADIRSYSLPNDLMHFYQEVGKDFQEELETLLDTLPKDNKERARILTENIKTVNPILSSWNDDLAGELYKSYKSFAKHVAKSSGGFLGMMSISKEERELIELPMLEKVVFFNEDE